MTHLFSSKFQMALLQYKKILVKNVSPYVTWMENTLNKLNVSIFSLFRKTCMYEINKFIVKTQQNGRQTKKIYQRAQCFKE